MDLMQLLKMLRVEVKYWQKDSLSEAYVFCTNHMREIKPGTRVYAWWLDLRKAIENEIENRRVSNE